MKTTIMLHVCATATDHDPVDTSRILSTQGVMHQTAMPSSGCRHRLLQEQYGIHCTAVFQTAVTVPMIPFASTGGLERQHDP